jgi:hypothetical protein
MKINIETQTINIDLVQPHPRNVRQGDVGAISESLQAHGQYKPITYQKSTGRILAGNHTWKAAKALGWKEINASGIECDDEEALRILLIDNRTNDLATYDFDGLIDILKDLEGTEASLQGTGFDGDALDELISDAKKDKELQDEFDKYTQSIKAPHNEIVGEQPLISELCDLTKYSKLVAEIEKAKIASEVSEFLIAAATRHIVFNYQKIAEFYPHQTAKIQKLMESSALVIIDAQDAIANGYAIFARTMNDLLIQDDDE